MSFRQYGRFGMIMFTSQTLSNSLWTNKYIYTYWCLRMLSFAVDCIHLTNLRYFFRKLHYSDVIMSAIASRITSISIVCSAVCSGADQRKHRSSASLAFVTGIHQWLVNSPHKGPVMRKMFHHEMIWNYYHNDLIMEIISLHSFSIWRQFHQRHLSHQTLKLGWKLHFQNFIKISQGSMS